MLQVGHLVEVEFGQRLAQGVVVGFSDEAAVEDTKPIISIIDEIPVVRPWQIELARWLSDVLSGAAQCLYAPDAAAGTDPLGRCNL